MGVARRVYLLLLFFQFDSTLSMSCFITSDVVVSTEKWRRTNRTRSKHIFIEMIGYETNNLWQNSF